MAHGYSALEAEGEIHLIPDVDIIEHDTSMYCDCAPLPHYEERATKEGLITFLVWEHRVLGLKENQQ